MSKIFDIVGIGGMYLDVIAHVPDKFITDHDMILDKEQETSVEKVMSILQDLPDPEYFAGGSVSNSIAGMANLGSISGFFGKVARDKIGKFLSEDMAARNIDICCPVYNNAAELSPICIAALTVNGERSISYNRACADTLNAQDFKEFNFSSAKIILIESDLLRNRDAAENILEVARLAKYYGSRVVFNLQGLESWENLPLIPPQIMDLADIIVGNEEESTAFQYYLSNKSDPDFIYVKTRGQNGVVAYLKDNIVEQPAIQPRKFISSLGAGDQFLAGFLKGLSDQLSINDSLFLGVKNATEILEETGGRPLHTAEFALSPISNSRLNFTR
jgi:sugar/nucleoside kinase (ribokinase family)